MRRLLGGLRAGLACAGAMTAFGVVTGCVLPAEDESATIEDIPPGLFTTTTAVVVEPGPEPEVRSFDLNLFWHDSNAQLVLKTRQSESQPSIADLLEALVQGPSETEVVQANGATVASRVSPALEATVELNENGVLIVTVSDAFSLREREEEKILITEELVCTFTSLKNVAAVRIDDTQGAIPLTGKDALVITGAATSADFGECAVQELVPVEDLEDEEAAES